MFNWSGASIQECIRAAKSGQTLPKAPGMTDITAELDAASGLVEAGKETFIGDIHRPESPGDPKTKKPLIDLKDNVFRFDIAGQKFTAKACGHADRNNAQNAGARGGARRGVGCPGSTHSARPRGMDEAHAAQVEV